jgi:transposase
MQELPDWVLKQKPKGTEIKGGRPPYYLYEVSSKWDPSIKRSRKKSGKFLGTITPEGLIKPKRERVLEELKNIAVKEYGATSYVSNLCADIFELLKRHFPDEWKEITIFSMVRLFHSSPMKNVIHYTGGSQLSDIFPDTSVSPKNLSELLFSIGTHRKKSIEFMKNFIDGEQAIIDVTRIFSLSENIISATLGHNGNECGVPQINMALLLSVEKKQPSFFRLVPGSISDVSIVTTTMQEAGLRKAILIGDKGFYSASNVKFLEKNRLGYVLPMKRTNSLIEYKPLSTGDMKDLDGYFLFEKRVVWFKERIIKGKRVILYLDSRLRTEEEKDFLTHVTDKKCKIKDYYRRQHTMGTIGVITNCKHNPEKVYGLLKSRIEIEQAFDAFKNILNSDRTYMRDDAHLEGWMFVNFVTLMLYYRIYEALRNKDLLKKFTPRDVILHFSRVQKLKIVDKWILSEVPKTTRILAEKLKFEIPIP